MSSGYLVAVSPGEKSETVLEMDNGFGTSPVIWDKFVKTYVGESANWMLGMEKIWDLYQDKKVPFFARAVLTMTYDRMIVLKKDYAKAAECIRQFLRAYPIDENRVNHWPAIAEFFESDPDVYAIGLWATDSSDNLYQGDWNEEAEEYDAPDFSQFWDAFKEIE